MSATTEAPEIPDWIYPGAKVILLVDDRHVWATPTIYRATVGKLAKFSFLVAFGKNGEREERINFKGLESKDQGSSWGRWKYRVIHPDSIEARRLRELRDRERSRNRMLEALRPLVEVNARERRDDTDVIREAVVALVSHGDLVHQQDTANPVHRAASGGQTRCGKAIDDHPHYVRYIDEGVTCPDCKETLS